MASRMQVCSERNVYWHHGTVTFARSAIKLCNSVMDTDLFCCFHNLVVSEYSKLLRDKISQS